MKPEPESGESWRGLHTEWVKHPMTQLFIKFLNREVENGCSAWLDGTLSGSHELEKQILGKSQAARSAVEYIHDGLFIEELKHESENSGVSGTYKAGPY